MIELSRTCGRVTVRLAALRAGPDWVVAIHGGDGPHVGAVALAGPGAGPATSGPCGPAPGARSLSLPGHREGALAEAAASALGAALGAAVSVSCGIHLDGATREEIALVEEAVELLALDLAAGADNRAIDNGGSG